MTNWIACAERLPELKLVDDGSMSESAEILAWIPIDGTAGRCTVANLHDLGDGPSWVADGGDSFYALDVITHWMPLPEPPAQRRGTGDGNES